MMIRALFILSVFSISWTNSASASRQVLPEDELVVSLFNNLYSLRFLDAKSDLAKIRRGNIDPDMKDICLANFHWWYIVTLEENAVHKTKMLAALDNIIERHKNSSEKNIYGSEIRR